MNSQAISQQLTEELSEHCINKWDTFGPYKPSANFCIYTPAFRSCGHLVIGINDAHKSSHQSNDLITVFSLNEAILHNVEYGCCLRPAETSLVGYLKINDLVDALALWC